MDCTGPRPCLTSLPAGCRQPLYNSRFSSVPYSRFYEAGKSSKYRHKPVRLKEKPGSEGAVAVATLPRAENSLSKRNHSRKGDGCDFQHRRQGQEPRSTILQSPLGQSLQDLLEASDAVASQGCRSCSTIATEPEHHAAPCHDSFLGSDALGFLSRQGLDSDFFEPKIPKVVSLFRSSSTAWEVCRLRSMTFSVNLSAEFGLTCKLMQASVQSQPRQVCDRGDAARVSTGGSKPSLHCKTKQTLPRCPCSGTVSAAPARSQNEAKPSPCICRKPPSASDGQGASAPALPACRG